MSSKFKLNKEDRNIADIQLDITQDSQMNSVEWHLAEKIYEFLRKENIILYNHGKQYKFQDQNLIYKQKFLNLAKEILGEKSDDNDTETRRTS